MGHYNTIMHQLLILIEQGQDLNVLKGLGKLIVKVKSGVVETVTKAPYI